VPTLYTALTVGSYADSHAAVYGQTNPLLIKSGDVVEVVINNHDVSSSLSHLSPSPFLFSATERDMVD